MLDQSNEAALTWPDATAPTDDFRRAVTQGLALPKKQLPCKYFYDPEGARLFTHICRLPEYYLTRSEMAILEQHAGVIAGLLPPGAVIVEFGSGTSRKIEYLLDHLERPAGYVPVDVSSTCLKAAARTLRARYKGLSISPVHADFTHPFELGNGLPDGPRVGFFPGSTIGNFDHAEATGLLRRFARALGTGCQLIVGVDLKKDVRQLHAAYNDAAGVTAAFNLNLLQRANRELAADFRVSQFVHRAPYNRVAGCIEMHLVSLRDQTVHIGDKRFAFRHGESIHTESSYKYDVEEFAQLAADAGFHLQQTWTDRRRMFSLHLLGS